MPLVIARVCNFLHVEEVLGMCTVALVCFLRNFFQSLDNDKVHKYLLWTYTLLSNTISGTLDCLNQYQEQLTLAFILLNMQIFTPALLSVV